MGVGEQHPERDAQNQQRDLSERKVTRTRSASPRTRHRAPRRRHREAAAEPPSALVAGPPDSSGLLFEGAEAAARTTAAPEPFAAGLDGHGRATSEICSCHLSHHKRAGAFTPALRLPTSACRRCARATCRRSASGAMEPFYPLHACVCERCLLVQLEEFVAAEDIFTEYAYFSSYSDSWVEHARDYVEMAVERFGLDSPEPGGRGREQRRLPAPARRRAGHPRAGHRAGRERRRGGAGRGSRRSSSSSAGSSRPPGRRGRRADLLVANNVMAHVPDLNDFVAGMAMLLAPRGVITIEFRTCCVWSRQPVRHHLPRALLVLLVPHRERVLARTGSRSSTSRSCPPTAARCASTPSVPEADPPAVSPRARRCRAGAGARLRHARGLRRVRPARRGDQVEAARVPDRPPRARASGSPATAPPARATRCSTTAGSAPICSSSPSTATPTSRGSSCPAPTSRSAIPRRSSRPGRTTS